MYTVYQSSVTAIFGKLMHKILHNKGLLKKKKVIKLDLVKPVAVEEGSGFS